MECLSVSSVYRVCCRKSCTPQHGVLCWLVLPMGKRRRTKLDEAHSQKVRSVMEYLKQGVYGPATQEQIAEAEAGQLVPILEARFVTSQDADVNARVARALLDLGDKSNAYWDFLVQQAKLVIESDAPSTQCYSSTNCTGHSAYVAWAHAFFVIPERESAFEVFTL